MHELGSLKDKKVLGATRSIVQNRPISIRWIIGSATYVLDQRSLMLESVTLAQVVELVIEVLIDLARIAILDQQPPENPQPTHPEHLTKVVFQQLNSYIAPDGQIALEVLIMSDLGILASAVPFLFPKPRCLPIRRAAVSSRARARECIVTCFRIISPSDTSLRMVWRELALEISLTSLGSSQILRLPHPTTDAASLF